MSRTLILYTSISTTDRERRRLFTADFPEGILCEEHVVSLPRGWRAAKSVTGKVLLQGPTGEVFAASQIVCCLDDRPVLRWRREAGEAYQHIFLTSAEE